MGPPSLPAGRAKADTPEAIDFHKATTAEFRYLKLLALLRGMIPEENAVRRTTRTVFLAAGLVVGLTACGSGTGVNEGADVDASSTTVLEQVSGLSAEDREARLVELAEEEGQLSLYINQSNLDKVVIPAFEEKYDIEVSLYRGTEAETLQRAAAEFNAGNHSFDIVGGSGATLQALEDLGAIAEYSSEYRDSLVESARVNDMWAAPSSTAFTPLYNTDKLKEADLPDDFLDFGNADWNGRTSFNTEDFEWYQAMYSYLTDQGVSRDEFEKAFTGMASNSQKVRSHLDMTTQLQAGQSDVSINNYLSYVTNEGSKGGPIAAKVYSPVVMRGLNYALASEAPNPAAAILWLDWVFGEGQNQMWESGNFPSNPDAVDGFQNPIDESIDVVYLDEVADLERINEWREAYTSLIEGNGDILPAGVE